MVSLAHVELKKLAYEAAILTTYPLHLFLFHKKRLQQKRKWDNNGGVIHPPSYPTYDLETYALKSRRRFPINIQNNGHLYPSVHKIALTLFRK